MLLDTIYYTRTETEDYHWVLRPDYVDAEAKSLLRPLFRLAENTGNGEYLRNRGRRNLYILPCNDFVMFCYIYLTGRKDSFGRQIYAVEGFACRDRARNFDRLQEFLMILIHDLMNPANEMGILRYGAGRLRPSMDYTQKSLSMKQLEQLEKEMERWNYGNVLSRLYQDLELRGSLFEAVVGTEPKNTYQMPEAMVYCVTDSEDLAVDDGGEIYRVPEEPDLCDLRFYLEHLVSDDAEVSTLSAVLSGGGMIWNSARDIFPTRADYQYAMKKGGILDEIPVKQVYQYFHTCEYALAKCSMAVRGGTFPCAVRPLGEQFISGSRQVCLEDIAEAFTFEIREPERKSDPEIMYPDDHQRAIMDWFRVSRRFGSDYYRNGGRDTLYVLNMEKGLWVFQFLEEKKGKAVIKGVCVCQRERRKAFRRMRMLLETEKELKKSLAKASPEFRKQLEAFLSDCEQHPVFSAVISTVIPAGAREKSAVKWYCPEIRRVEIPVAELARDQKQVVWKLNPTMCGNVSLVPKSRKLLQRETIWAVNAYVLDPNARRKHAESKFVFREQEIDLNCVDASGTFLFEEFHRNFSQMNAQLKFDYFYLCPKCGSNRMKLIRRSKSDERRYSNICECCGNKRYGERGKDSLLGR